jgi:hypothetical protein
MARKYCDFKVTVWCRAHLDDVDLNQIIEAFKNGEGSNYLFNEELAYDWETLVDTELPIRVEDNNGDSTIEVYEDDKQIWNNSKKD